MPDEAEVEGMRLSRTPYLAGPRGFSEQPTEGGQARGRSSGAGAHHAVAGYFAAIFLSVVTFRVVDSIAMVFSSGALARGESVKGTRQSQ